MAKKHTTPAKSSNANLGFEQKTAANCWQAPRPHGRPMTVETHSQLANFIWNICNLPRGPYKRNEYRIRNLEQQIVRSLEEITGSDQEPRQ